MEGVTIRQLEVSEDFRQAEEAQRLIWSMPDAAEVVPLHLLVTAQKNGGLVLGAYDAEGRMIGVLFGFLGRTADGRIKHCSHMMGVLPQYRQKGVGHALKCRQRQFVLDQGLDLVTWTYDPLEGPNATVNISKLGVICSTYLRNVYGAMQDGLNVGMDSDRFEVEWWIRSQRVEERLTGKHVRFPLEEWLEQGAEKVNQTDFTDEGLALPVNWQRATGPLAVVEIPGSIQAIKVADMDLAQAWRRHTRDIFEAHFASGYVAVEFVSHMERGRRRNFYVLSRSRVVGQTAFGT